MLVSSSDMSIAQVVISNSFHTEGGKQWYSVFRVENPGFLAYATLRFCFKPLLRVCKSSEDKNSTCVSGVDWHSFIEPQEK